MISFTRLAFLCIPGSIMALTLWAAIFGISAPAWLINIAGVAGMATAAALAYKHNQQRR